MSGDSQLHGRRHEYRGDRAGPCNSSDDNSDSEEDTPLWRQKQEKYFRKQKETEAMCSSPTLPEVRTSLPPGQSAQRKKSNNIWGSVLTEQDLTQTMVRSAAVDKPEELSFNERNVESYDFTKKYEDKRLNWDEPESPDDKNELLKPSINPRLSAPVPGRSIIGYDDTIDKSRESWNLNRKLNRQSRKRKTDGSNDREQRSSIHDRLGAKKLTTTRLGDIEMTVNMETSELTSKIADFLHEPKVEIIERIITNLGKEFAIRLVQATKDIEESGGMYTLDGSRRRTPGGVYLTLLKQQPEWNKDVRKLVFVEDVEEQQKHRKETRKKAKRRRKKQAGKGNEQENDKSRSRSNSKSRSRSNSNSSSKSTPYKKDSTEVGMEEGEVRPERRSENDGGNIRNRKSRKYESSEESDEEGQVSNWSKPFNFEDELAAAKKLIAEKANAKSNTDTEMMESEVNVSQDKENVADMSDLETAEANVVDIEIGIDNTG